MTGEEVIALLERAYLAAEARLQRQIDFETSTYGHIPAWVEVTPAEIRDRNGRFILLDALVALVQVKTAFGPVVSP